MAGDDSTDIIVGVDGIETPVAAEVAQSICRGGLVERIILVHGTGAGRSSWRDSSKAENPRILFRKWWQPTSKFAQELSASLGSRYRIILPFRWDVSNGGGNSERARRVAGKRLLERLRRLDNHSLTYHLVGHSHGGSVIWHALVGSFLDSHGPLKGLKTWTTVGTPFFSWRPDPLRWWWTFAAGLFVATLAIEAPALRDLWLERALVVQSIEQKDILLGLAAALVMVTILALTVGRLTYDIRTSLGSRSNRRAAAKARKQYGSKWLGLWHTEDEPIALLSATMLRAPELVPRGQSSISITKPLSALLNICRLIYSKTLAAAADEFTWSVLMRRAQGADVPGLRATFCRAAPEMMSMWPPLPNPVAQSMSASADEGIASSAAQIRRAATALNRAQNTRRALASLGALIDWSLLLHTSYFDQRYVLTTITDWIRTTSPRPRASAKSPARFTSLPLHLTAAKGFAASVIAVGLALGADSLLEAGVARHLSSRQMSLTVERIHESSYRSDMLVTGETYSSPIADVLGRLAVIESLSLPRLIQAIDRTPSEDASSRARQRLAYFLARRDQISDALKLAGDFRSQTDRARLTEAALIRMQVIIGAHYSGRQIGALTDFRDVVSRTGMKSIDLIDFLPHVLKVAADRGFFDDVLSSINWDSFREWPSDLSPSNIATFSAVTLLRNGYVMQAIKLADSVRDEATKQEVYAALGSAAFKEPFVDHGIMRLIWSNVGSAANSEVASRNSLLRAIALSNDPLDALAAELDKYDAKYDDDIKNSRFAAEGIGIDFNDTFLFEMVRKSQRNDLVERINAELLKTISRFPRMNEAIWRYVAYLQRYHGQESARAWCQGLSGGEAQDGASLSSKYSVSAICFKALGDSERVEKYFDAATALLPRISNVDQRIRLSIDLLTTTIESPSSHSHSVLTQLVSDMYKTQEQLLYSPAETIAIRFYCLENNFNDAWSIANRANRPDVILERYSMILDMIIMRTFSDGFGKWGFDPRQQPPSTVGHSLTRE